MRRLAQPVARAAGARVKRIAVVGVLLMASGCSWLFVTPPSRDARTGAPAACTSSSGAPVADVVFAIPPALIAVTGILLIAVARDVDGECRFLCDKSETIALGATFLIGGGLVTAPFVASASYGFKHTGRCREQQQRRAGEDGDSFVETPHLTLH